jgi:hypothetical protein
MTNRDEAADVAIHDFSNRYVSQVLIGKDNVCLDGIEKSILFTEEVEFTKIFLKLRLLFPTGDFLSSQCLGLAPRFLYTQ